jgi:hypothetical protein
MVTLGEMTMVTTTQSDLTQEKVQEAIDVLLSGVLPVTENQTQAFLAFRDGDYKQVKKLSLLNLTDRYIQALGYLSGALNPVNLNSGNSYTILAESARNFKLHDDLGWYAIEEEFNSVFA